MSTKLLLFTSKNLADSVIKIFIKTTFKNNEQINGIDISR